MEEIIRLWPKLQDRQSLACSVQCYVSKLYIYPASPKPTEHWRTRGVEGSVLCQDLLLLDSEGLRLRVMVSPLLRTLAVLEDTFIIVKAVEKISHGTVKLAVLTEWELGPEFRMFDLESQIIGYKEEVKLSGYADQSRPLSNPSSELLCPWTCSNVSWSDHPKLTKKYLFSQLKSIKFNPDIHNLSNLNQIWHTTSQPMPLVVRVLAKCKERLIIKQSDPRKSSMSFCNLLVADLTAYSVVTFWDEAVAAIHQTVKEGDILVLTSYKAASLRTDHRKLMHNMAPKVGGAGHILSATEIECKVNPSDLGRVFHLDSAAVCDSVPPLITNFVSSREMYEKVRTGRLVDTVGIVVFHGRWEREAVYRSGHHYVRVWLNVMDQTSDNELSIKVYPDLESWVELEEALPGKVVLITNLNVRCNEEGNFSYLESTNQTGVFTDQNAMNSRFLSFPVVSSFKAALDENLVQWEEVMAEKGGMGGQFLLGPSVQSHYTPTDLMTAVSTLNHLEKTVEAISYRSGRRLLVKGNISGAKVFKINVSGDFSEIKTLIEEDSVSKNYPVFGPQCAIRESFPSSVEKMSEDQLSESVKYFCFLNSSLSVQKPETVTYRESQFGLVSFLLDDCKLILLVTEQLLNLITSTYSEYYVLGRVSIDFHKPTYVMD